MNRILACAVAALALGGAALAQTSASHRLTESTFNSGGDPWNGAFGASASHRVKLDAVGDGLMAVGLSSASYRMDGGFVDVYPPPGEVQHALFSDKTTLVWDPEKSVGQYAVYRDGMGVLSGGGTGTCFASSLSSETAVDATMPPAGQGYFYLVTARNRLLEEGTKGKRSSGLERPNPAPCP
jgi:hypothetical protein